MEKNVPLTINQKQNEDKLYTVALWQGDGQIEDRFGIYAKNPTTALLKCVRYIERNHPGKLVAGDNAYDEDFKSLSKVVDKEEAEDTLKQFYITIKNNKIAPLKTTHHIKVENLGIIDWEAEFPDWDTNPDLYVINAH